MLSEVQKSMIDYQVDQHLHGVNQIYVRERASDPYKKLTDFIGECLVLVVDSKSPKNLGTVSFLGKKSPTERLKVELAGIFNPNFDILQQLGVINNVRDKIKITKEDFPAIVSEIRSYAIERVSKVIKSYMTQSNINKKL